MQASAAPAPRVLLVDDDHDLRRLVAEALALEGIETATAGDPSQALALCTGGEPYSVVLLDWRLGRASGRDVALALGALPEPRPPIVLFTGAGDVVEHAEAIGARGFLKKPFDLDQLIELVRRFAPPARGDASPARSAEVTSPARPRPTARRESSQVSSGRGAARRQRLRWMATEVERLRQELGALQSELRALAAAERNGASSPAARTRGRDLRLASEALRLRLTELRAEFEALRAGPWDGTTRAK